MTEKKSVKKPEQSELFSPEELAKTAPLTKTLQQLLNPLERGIQSYNADALNDKFVSHTMNAKQKAASEAVNQGGFLFAESLLRNLNHPEQTDDLIEKILDVKRAAIARISGNSQNYS